MNSVCISFMHFFTDSLLIKNLILYLINKFNLNLKFKILSITNFTNDKNIINISLRVT